MGNRNGFLGWLLIVVIVFLAFIGQGNINSVKGVVGEYLLKLDRAQEVGNEAPAPQGE
jgi:hypothetical protein